MRIEVAGSPEDENRLETFVFAFHPASLRITLVEAKRFVRSDEYAAWRETGHWFYPDLEDKSSMDEPTVPDWAVCNARFFISERISFQQ